MVFLQERKIFLPTVFPNRHHGMAVVVKHKHEGGGNVAVTVRKIPPNQLALANESLGGGMVIVIGHKNRVPRMREAYAAGTESEK